MQKEYRLKNNASFNYIYKKGEYRQSSLIILKYVKAHSLKVGISVSKRIGNSVVRHRVKRMISESFRLMIPKLTVICNYVVIAKEGAAVAGYREIESSIRHTLEKINHIEASATHTDAAPPGDTLC